MELDIQNEADVFQHMDNPLSSLEAEGDNLLDCNM